LLAAAALKLWSAEPTKLTPAPSGNATQPADLVITGDNNGQFINVAAAKAGDIHLSLKNTSDHEITLTHFSFNSPAVFTPIDPLVLKAGAGATFPLFIDSRALFLPSSVTVYFRIHDAKGDEMRSARLILTSKESLIVVPRFVFWRIGEPATAKVVHIAQMPAGIKIVGVKAASNEITATLDAENNVVIKPVDTDKPRNTSVTLLSEPASANPTTIPVLILPASAKVAPADLSTRQVSPSNVPAKSP